MGQLVPLLGRGSGSVIIHLLVQIFSRLSLFQSFWPLLLTDAARWNSGWFYHRRRHTLWKRRTKVDMFNQNADVVNRKKTHDTGKGPLTLTASFLEGAILLRRVGDVDVANDVDVDGGMESTRRSILIGRPRELPINTLFCTG